MELNSMASTQAGLALGVLAKTQKDTTGAQLIAQTLDKLNSTDNGAGVKVDTDYQFQKTVLSAAGLGNKLDTFA